MRLRLWLPSLLLLGCAHAPSVSEERVARLPPSARQQILQSQAGVDAADQNLNAARAALSDAARFVDVTDRELDAARAHSEAARAGIELGQRANAPRTLRAAQERDLNATRELFATRAKKDYAERMVSLRRAQLEQRRAERELARADFEYLKFSLLQQRGQANDLRPSDFAQPRLRARNELAQARLRVAGLQGEVEMAHMAWVDRSHSIASRVRDITPPPAPEAVDLPPERGFGSDFPANQAPAGGANEGPTSAPQAIPQD